MADQYGMVKINKFKVVDYEKFVEFIGNYLFNQGNAEDEWNFSMDRGRISAVSSGQYSRAVPYERKVEASEWEEEELLEIDFEEFAQKFSTHMKKGETTAIYAFGNEKGYYFNADEYIISWDGKWSILIFGQCKSHWEKKLREKYTGKDTTE